MSFIRTRTIKGNRYSYREYRWREGGRVRSKSVYLGVGSSSEPGPDHGRGQFGYAPFAEEEAAKVAAPSQPTAAATPAAPPDADKEAPAEAGAKEVAEEGADAPSE